MNILGIYRSSEFSPNMVDRDAAIMNLVADELRSRGHEVTTIKENDLKDISFDCTAYDRVFGMERNESTINMLIQKNDGARFINPLQGIQNCRNRSLLTRLFMNTISMPASAIYEKESCRSDGDITFPFWIKRGDGYAQTKEDTSYVTGDEEARSVIESFKRRGIQSFVVQKHIEGDLIKFYGVEGTRFFDWDYASSNGFSKFGLEKINGTAKGIKFSVSQLKELADTAAKTACISVYGGDCIIDSEGKIYIIDINDWPSFARCKEKASKAIAERILK